jgi:hypothetical protein
VGDVVQLAGDARALLERRRGGAVGALVLEPLAFSRSAWFSRARLRMTRPIRTGAITSAPMLSR